MGVEVKVGVVRKGVRVDVWVNVWVGVFDGVGVWVDVITIGVGWVQELIKNKKARANQAIFFIIVALFVLASR